MKEKNLIDMQRKVEAVGNVLQQIIAELEQLKTLAVGNMELTKLLPCYDDALMKMREKMEKANEDKKLDLDGQE